EAPPLSPTSRRRTPAGLSARSHTSRSTSSVARATRRLPRSRYGSREERLLRRHQHESEARPAAFSVLDIDAAAVALRDLPDDREAQTGARLAARRLGAIEAVEDERPGHVADTRAVVT